jgi:serine/threonine protein kinase
VAPDAPTADVPAPVQAVQPAAQPIPNAAPPAAKRENLAPRPPVAAPVPPIIEPAVPRDITTGSLLNNRYLLGRLLGAGGSSLIFQAEDRRRIGADDFGSCIAIKVLRSEMRHNAHALTRLKREFRQMQRLAHPGVARVFEIACDEDIWFMTMELIEGQTVNQWLKAGPLRPDGLQVISSCCEALAHAHDNGVVHGDLKPSNVLVLPTGGVKLVDFGSAAERDATTGQIEKERSFAATPPYASPQVLAGDIADPRDDVFSLACLTYAVLTNGEHPFDRKSSTEARQSQLRPTYARAIHPRQFDVIVRALSWERDQRPAHIREFMHALLASDLRREPSSKDVVTASVDVTSQPIGPGPAREHVATATRAPTPTPQGQTSVTRKPKAQSALKPGDIARLKAAVAAAEAHAERVGMPSEPIVNRDDPLDRFRGYVAGPMASPEESEIDEPEIDQRAATQFNDEEPIKKPKRLWPWQRATLVVLAVAGLAAAIATQLDMGAEPFRQAEAHAVTPPMDAAATLASPLEQEEAIEQAPTQTDEKKSAQAAMKPTPAPARGEVSFSTRTLTVGAGQTMAALNVTRSNSTAGRARVGWTIEGGTAQPGVHYQLPGSQVMEFLDGQRVRSLFIPLTPDKDSDGVRLSKTFTVKLQQAAGEPALGEIKQVYVTIVGDVTGSSQPEALAVNTDTAGPSG